MNINVYLVCAALLVLVFVLLSVWVVVLRNRTGLSFGNGGELLSPLALAIRAHGNSAEYLGPALALMLYMSISPGGDWPRWAAVLLTAARISHPIALLLGDNPKASMPFRAFGIIGTCVGLAALAVLLLMRGLA